MNLGDLCLAISDVTGSGHYYQQALASQQKITSKEPLSRLMIGIGKSRYAKAEFEGSLQYASRATDLGRELGNLEVLWKSRTLAGESQIKLGRPTEAKSSFVDAITVIERLPNQLAGGVQDQELFFESKHAPYHPMVDLPVQQRDCHQAFSYL
jgi:hypothetical protein